MEKLYRELLTSLSAFYAGGTSAGAAQFLEQTRLAWLYAPDDVINNLYAFLNTQKPDVPKPQKDLEGRRTMASLVAAIRADLFDTVKKTTQLSAIRFPAYRVNPPGRPLKMRQLALFIGRGHPLASHVGARNGCGRLAP